MNPLRPRLPEIIAHRGASHDAPENTLAAARLAWAQGADALECDVHLTRDGRLAVVHDDDLERVAGTRIRVADASIAELRRFDVGGWKGPGFRGEVVPLLDELLALTPPAKRLFVELKGGAELVPALAGALARAAHDFSRLVVIAFDLAAAGAAKRALPAVEVGWVIERSKPGPTPPIAQLVAAAGAARIDGLDLDHEWPLDADVARTVRAAGLKLYAWTVDDPGVAARLAAHRIDGITTNRPGWLRASLGEALQR